MKTLRAYNVQIWCGLKKQYTDKIYSIQDVRTTCDEHCKDGDCVTITKTEYRYKGGYEKGVVVGYIQYPRFPRKKKEILRRALMLAETMLIKLEQYRVTVTTPYKSYMISSSK